MKIKLKNGSEFYIDDSDYNLLTTSFGIQKVRNYNYVYVFIYDGGVKKFRYLHRLIMQAPSGKFVDHINGNTLDNRRCNLRICDNKQNQWNQRKIRGAVPYKGVTFERGMYRSRIRVNGKKIDLGRFSSKEDAAKAYKNAAIKYYGQFSFSNI